MTDVNDCIGRPPDSGCQNKLALLAGALRNFCENRGGNIVVTFALALAPTLALTGAAVDYSRANADRAAMQSALDSTSLAMAKDAASLSAADLQTKGLAYFNAQFKKAGVSGVAFNISYSSSASGPKVVATASASVKNMFMNLPGLGFVSIPIAAGSTVAWSNSRLRVALALDNTGSMADSGKMTALKVAAKALIDQLKAASTVDGDVYVSIIPFAKDVNSGPSNYIANWLSWTSWDDSVGSPKNCDKRGTTALGFQQITIHGMGASPIATKPTTLITPPQLEHLHTILPSKTYIARCR
jgi:Flp pilus assembly protein TadG